MKGTPTQARGRRTGVRVQVPAEKLPSRTLYSRQARRLDEEARVWDERNRALLEAYGLRLSRVTVLPLVPAGGGGRAPAGALQTEMRDRLLLAAGLGALSVSATGRGELLAYDAEERDRVKSSVKETNDRNATGVMTEALHALCAAHPDVRLRIAIGEGARLKPGEKGGNPTLYAGQVIGSGGRTYSLAVDTVEGTTKSAMFDHSCGTLLYATEATIAPVPDVYFNKCQLFGVDEVTVADPLPRILEALRDARSTSEINLFALDRPRHPIDSMVEMGASMRVDTDGDAYPVLAAGLRWGVFPDNARPLDGVCGNIGGAAEMIASAAAGSYLGVRSTARFCAATIRRWEQRYDFGPGEEDALRAAGFDPSRAYRIEDLVTGLERCDGALVAAAIADNWHIPGLDACFVGGDFARVAALFVGAAGAADLYELTFDYPGGIDRAADALTPVLTRLLRLPLSEIPAAVRRAVADPADARRLRREIATSYYMHVDPGGGDGSGRLALDLEAAARAESAEATALLRAAAESAPDWFA